MLQILMGNYNSQWVSMGNRGMGNRDMGNQGMVGNNQWVVATANQNTVVGNLKWVAMANHKEVAPA